MFNCLTIILPAQVRALYQWIEKKGGFLWFPGVPTRAPSQPDVSPSLPPAAQGLIENQQHVQFITEASQLAEVVRMVDAHTAST